MTTALGLASRISKTIVLIQRHVLYLPVLMGGQLGSKKLSSWGLI